MFNYIQIKNGECVLPDGKMVSYKKNIKRIEGKLAA